MASTLMSTISFPESSFADSRASPSAKSINSRSTKGMSADMSTFSSPLLSKTRPLSDIVFDSPPIKSFASRMQSNQGNQPGHSLYNGTNSGNSGHGVYQRPLLDSFNSFGSSGSSGPDDITASARLAHLEDYETMLEKMSSATLDKSFKDELSSVEQWFGVLSEHERTATIYALLQQTSQLQIRFFMTVLNQMARTGSLESMEPLGRLPDDHALLSSSVASSNYASSTTSNSSSKQDDDSTSSSSSDDTPDLAAGSFNSQTFSAIGSEKIAASRPTSADVSFPVMSSSTPFSPVTGSWASLMNTPVSDSKNVTVSTALANAEMVASATAMKLAALSTVNNRIILDSERKIRKRSLLDRVEYANPSVTSSPSPFISTAEATTPFTGASQCSVSRSPWLQSSVFQSVSTPSRGNVPQQRMFGFSPLPDIYSSPLFVDNRTSGSPYSVDNTNLPNISQMGTGAYQPGSISSAGVGSIVNGNCGIATPANNGSKNGVNLSSVHNKSSGTPSPMSVSHSNSTDTTIPTSNGSTTASSASSTTSTVSSVSSSSISSSGKHKDDPTDMTLLRDIPTWLRSLRLHKYTDNLKDLHWSDLVELTDEQLISRGVNALGARRKMLKVFEQVKAVHKTTSSASATSPGG
ncbi:hypothetical protein V1511DRAFT_486301 [Dipodascopsis uninucleata]